MLNCEWLSCCWDESCCAAGELPRLSSDQHFYANMMSKKVVGNGGASSKQHGASCEGCKKGKAKIDYTEIFPKESKRAHVVTLHL